MSTHVFRYDSAPGRGGIGSWLGTMLVSDDGRDPVISPLLKAGRKTRKLESGRRGLSAAPAQAPENCQRGPRELTMPPIKGPLSVWPVLGIGGAEIKG